MMPSPSLPNFLPISSPISSLRAATKAAQTARKNAGKMPASFVKIIAPIPPPIKEAAAGPLDTF